MYRTYKPGITDKAVFEERLIPKEVPVAVCGNKCEKKDSDTGISGGFFDNFSIDDILLIAILMLLFYENCEDNILITVLIVLLVTGL